MSEILPTKVARYHAQLQAIIENAEDEAARLEMLEQLLVAADEIQSAPRGLTEGERLVRALERLRPTVDAAQVKAYPVPISLYEAAEVDGQTKTMLLYPPEGMLYIGGIRTFSEPHEIRISAIRAGGEGRNLLGTEVDAAIFNQVAPFLPWDVGVVSRDMPAQVAFAAAHTVPDPPWLDLTLFGQRPPTPAPLDPHLPISPAPAPGSFWSRQGDES